MQPTVDEDGDVVAAQIPPNDREIKNVVLCLRECKVIERAFDPTPAGREHGYPHGFSRMEVQVMKDRMLSAYRSLMRDAANDEARRLAEDEAKAKAAEATTAADATKQAALDAQAAEF